MTAAVAVFVIVYLARRAPGYFLLLALLIAAASC
jgi:hypothetical protein